MTNTMQNLLGAATAAGLIFASLALTAPEAKSAEAVWYEGDGWTVKGDYAGYCSASASWYGGNAMSINLVNGSGWSMMFGSARAVPMVVDKVYEVAVTTSIGQRYTLVGKAMDTQIVIFEGLTGETVKGFALARTVSIGSVGTFGMKGSMKAILKTVDCFRAITGKAA